MARVLAGGGASAPTQSQAPAAPDFGWAPRRALQKLGGARAGGAPPLNPPLGLGKLPVDGREIVWNWYGIP